MSAKELARIADIIPPSPPLPSYPSLVLLLSAVLLLLVVMITLYWYRHATAAKLWRLGHSYRNARCTQRELSQHSGRNSVPLYKAPAMALKRRTINGSVN
jgi:hypothetical protein